jgi:hypothetical protein
MFPNAVWNVMVRVFCLMEYFYGWGRVIEGGDGGGCGAGLIGWGGSFTGQIHEKSDV